MRINRSLLLLTGLLLTVHIAPAQFRSRAIRWSADGNATLSSVRNGISRTDVRTGTEAELVSAAELTPAGGKSPIAVADFAFSRDSSTVLIFTNTARVWRYNTRGDYYVLTRPAAGRSGTLRQVGAGQPSQSLLYAKLSPDGKRVAYVSKNNLFSEDIATGKITQLTTDGTRQRINGTFDWAYEEEFGCRDGFRWSPDSKQLLYWQVDASKIRDFLMIDNTDSIYSYTIPVEYPKVGESPSPTRIGVVSATGGRDAVPPTKWLAIPGDPVQHYLVRAEWFPTTGAAGNELIIQQLNRKQNESILYVCQPAKNTVTPIFTETDKAWIDIKARWDRDDPTGWEWTNGGNSFLWVSEKDGWRHIYQFSRDGKTQTLLTPGNYDMAELERIDERGGPTATADRSGYVYFTASPDNATQRYLYRVPLNGAGKNGPAERLSPANQAGTHGYDVSPNGQFALHTFTNATTPPSRNWINLPDHSPLRAGTSAARSGTARGKNIRFFTVTTADNITLDGWMALPPAFDSTKRYPIVFQVYGEPAATTTNDVFSAGNNDLFMGDMLREGYIYAALDNRGTPALKGAAWRKSIYRQIGRMNIRDQAMGAKALFARHSFIDTSRVAVWGWSGGGSTTLNLLFQYPDIYQTGIAVAAVANQLTYDNIYQERYMGLPQENREDFVAGSPITYAKGLKGNLLYIHGTGDDNVHYANAEMLVNELVKYNKTFQFMAYPNRSHGIFEGAGTRQHLSTLYTDFLKKNCPAGGR